MIFLRCTQLGFLIGGVCWVLAAFLGMVQLGEYGQAASDALSGALMLGISVVASTKLREQRAARLPTHDRSEEQA